MLPVRPLAFQHRSIGKQTHAQGTAAAHIRYITRANACTHFETENMPDSRDAAITYFDHLSERPGERIDARICDKLIIALPLDIGVEERREAMRSFMRKLGRGRIPWCAAFHEHGKDTRNPHVHVVFRDRDIDSNRRVMGTSTSPQELSQARQNGRPRPPLMTSERLRHMWCEHLSNFYVDRGTAVTASALPSRPVSALR
jgi:hypothetical protein